MTFVATDDMDLLNAQAERQRKIETLIETVWQADGWLTSREIAAQTDMAAKFARCLGQELTGTWLLQREACNGAYEFSTPEGWVVEGCESERGHTNPECQHLKTFSHRPATDGELAVVTECKECSDEPYRADEQDWSVYRAAREAGADD